MVLVVPTGKLQEVGLLEYIPSIFTLSDMSSIILSWGFSLNLDRNSPSKWRETGLKGLCC